MFEVVVIAVWAMLPAYVPNNAAVLFGGGRPIDGGRTHNGKRLLGDGKTWRGTAGGTGTGIFVALVLNVLVSVIPANDFLPTFPVFVVVALPFGAMLGDLFASFVKRRLGRNRGTAVPGLDQLDFVVGALVLTALVSPGWFLDTFTLPVIVVVLVITPIFHLSSNIAAYQLGWKDEPY
jgi:CDP-2,3-bis-(O-geranylgeranyl)-sn-glycerol synthase